jgi:hypothetical protein
MIGDMLSTTDYHVTLLALPLCDEPTLRFGFVIFSGLSTLRADVDCVHFYLLFDLVFSTYKTDCKRFSLNVKSKQETRFAKKPANGLRNPRKRKNARPLYFIFPDFSFRRVHAMLGVL